METPSDDALMAAFAAGDAGAFERLFERHRRPLFTHLLHHTGNAGRAEDLFQEVFLRLIRGRERYRAGNFRAWLFTVAHNALTDDRRRSALRASHEEAAMTERSTRDDSLGDPVAGSHAGDLRARIEAALQRLPEAQREVFLLRERGGLELARIAEVTGANLATVKSRLRYALAGLRRLLATELASLPETLHE